MLYLLLIFISVAMGAVSLYRAMRKGKGNYVWLAAFWLLLVAHLYGLFPYAFEAALICVVVFVVLQIRSRPGASHRRTIEEIQKSLGYTSEEVRKLHQELKTENEKRSVRENAQAIERLDLEARQQRYNAQARPRGIIFQVELPSPVSPTDQGGEPLQLGPGPLEIRVEIDAEKEGDYANLKVRNYLKDDQGTSGKLESAMYLPGLVAMVMGPDDRDITAWSAAPEVWHLAMKENCQAAGAKTLLDGREGYSLLVGGQRYEYFEKYQEPSIDIAWLVNSESWLVRVAGLYHEPAEVDSDEEEDLGEVDDSSEEPDLIPPFAWVLPKDTLAIPLHPDLFAEVKLVRLSS